MADAQSAKCNQWLPCTKANLEQIKRAFVPREGPFQTLDLYLSVLLRFDGGESGAILELDAVCAAGREDTPFDWEGDVPRSRESPLSICMLCWVCFWSRSRLFFARRRPLCFRCFPPLFELADLPSPKPHCTSEMNSCGDILVPTVYTTNTCILNTITRGSHPDSRNMSSTFQSFSRSHTARAPQFPTLAECLTMMHISFLQMSAVRCY